MANGAQPAGGGHWLAAAPPYFRERVVQKIMKNLPQVLQGKQVKDPHGIASRYEDNVFNLSDNLEDYLRTISMKMMCFQQKRQPVVQPASGQHQQGHQMRPLNAVLVNSSTAGMPRTASTIPLSVKPHQVQNIHTCVNQARLSFATPVAPVAPLQWHHAPPNTTSTTPVAPVVQLHPRHPAVVTQVQTQGLDRHNSTQQPRPQLTRMNQQQDMGQSYHTHGGQQSNVVTMQIGHHGGQNSHQSEHPNNQQSAVQVDWREDMFQKIKSLKEAHWSELIEFAQALRACVLQIKANGQLESLPKEQAVQYRNAVNMSVRIRTVLSFLQLQKSNIPKDAKDQLDKLPTAIDQLLCSYRANKARNAGKNAGHQSQNCREPPRAADTAGATDSSKQNHQEQPAAEALPHPSQNVPATSPLAQQQNHSDHLAGEAENVEVRLVAEAPVAINLAPVTGDTLAPLADGTCSQEMQQEHPTQVAIPQLAKNVDPAGIPPSQKQTRSVLVEPEDDSVRAEAETLVAVEAAKTTFSPAGGTCNQEVPQDHQTDEAIPQLAQNVDPSGTPPAQQQNRSAHSVQVEAEDDSVRAEAETPVAMETLIKRGINAGRSLSPAALRSLASEMGVNLKRAFGHTTSGPMDGSSCAGFDDESSRHAMDGSSCARFEDDRSSGSGESCYKRRKTHEGSVSVLDEIRTAYGKLVETEISISEDDTRGVEGTVIELSYNAVSLTTDLRAVIGTSEIRTKLLVPPDYPRSSPVILGGGEGKKGVPAVVDVAFRRALVLLWEHRSIEGIARAWDSVARSAVVQFVQFVHRLNGGMYATRKCRWESCIPV